MNRLHGTVDAFVMLPGAAAPAAASLEPYGNLPQVELMRICASGPRVEMIAVPAEKRQRVVAGIAQEQGAKCGERGPARHCPEDAGRGRH